MVEIERGVGYKGSLRAFWRDQSFANVINGIADGTIFGLISVPLIMKAAAVANIPEQLLYSWMLAIYLGGIVTIIMALYYRLPIVGAWSIPGAVALAQVLSNFTPAEIVGGFIVAGVIDLFLGLTGVVRVVIRKIPKDSYRNYDGTGCWGIVELGFQMRYFLCSCSYNMCKGG